MDIHRDEDRLKILPYDPRSEPLPIPAVGPFDTPLRYLTVNAEWASHLIGALARLEYSDAWSGTENEIDAALQNIGEIIAQLMNTNTNYALIIDEKPSGTAGGSSAANTWNPRTLNTIKINGIANLSLAPDQGVNAIYIPTGTYRIRCSAPAFSVGRHKARVSIQPAAQGQFATQYLYGTSERVYNTYLTQTTSCVVGEFTIPGTGILKVTHNTANAVATEGLGTPAQFDVPEIYTVLELWKVA